MPLEPGGRQALEEGMEQRAPELRNPWTGRGDNSRASGRAAHGAQSQHWGLCLAHVEAGKQHTVKAQEYVKK